MGVPLHGEAPTGVRAAPNLLVVPRGDASYSGVPSRSNLLETAYQASRQDLLAYLTRLVVRAEVAEELLQEASLRFLQVEKSPPDAEGCRAWLFRVATNLAVDHLRRHSSWRESVLVDARDRAEQDRSFVAESRLLIGSPEMRTIAREHLALCFSCTLRNLPSHQAAALLLVEVHGFAVREAADILDATFGQVKSWIQAARATMQRKYAETCALITKRGVCYQCVELSEFFTGGKEDPLAGTAGDMEARLTILRERRASELGPWHRRMMRIVDDMLDVHE